MSDIVSLSEAKAKLSELVRNVRLSGADTIITVDGEPAVRVVPIQSAPRTLTDAEVSVARALWSGLQRVERASSEFDALELVGEGRR